MADILSLSKARKTKAKVEKEATAAANRAKFGMSKAEKLKLKVEKTIAEKIVDAHKRES
jgi:hypothetical protein